MGLVTAFYNAEVLEVGIDWITATGKEGDTCELLATIAAEARTGAEECGFFTRRLAFQGYAGYGGEGWFFGTRPDSACLRLSGSTAHRLCRDVAMVDCHVSRFDAQVTLRDTTVGPDYARQVIDAWRNDTRGKASVDKLRTKLVDAGMDGTTAYFGAKAAARHSRIYDKHAESQGTYPPHTWRCEAEIKRQLAGPAWERITGVDFDRGFLLGFIKGWFAHQGVHLTFQGGVPLEVPIVTRVTSDAERKLEWLKKTAQPVVRQLCEAGYSAQVADALYGWLMPEAEK